MAVVHVAHFETGAFARKAARPQSGKTALMRQLCQRVGLIHELRQLRTAEELLDRRHHRTDIDQHLGRDRFHILNGHPLAHHALHTRKADAELVLQQLAHRTQTAVAEMVDIVRLHLAIHQTQEHAYSLDDIRLGQITQIIVIGRNFVLRQANIILRLVVPDTAFFINTLENAMAQLLFHFITADIAQVITLGVEEKAMQQQTGRFHCRRLARTQTLVDFH